VVKGTIVFFMDVNGGEASVCL